jgi:general secretion pathway protein D
MNRIAQVWIVLFAVVLAAPAYAEAEKGQHYGAYPPVQLAAVLESVSKKTGRVFLTDNEVPGDIVVGQLPAKDLTYSTLLIVLFNNGLAAVTVGDVTNIVVAAKVRQHALPTIFADDDSIDDYEWVTRVVEVKNTNAAQLVPILRPMVPQMGHLVAHAGSNTLVIAARYDNAKRLADIISRIDARATQQSGD